MFLSTKHVGHSFTSGARSNRTSLLLVLLSPEDKPSQASKQSREGKQDEVKHLVNHYHSMNCSIVQSVKHPSIQSFIQLIIKYNIMLSYKKQEISHNGQRYTERERQRDEGRERERGKSNYIIHLPSSTSRF